MMNCLSPDHKEHVVGEGWRFCVLCRTERQASSALRRALRRKIEWPSDDPDVKQPIRDTSTCTIDEAIGAMMQYLTTSTRHCKKYYNGTKESRKNGYDRQHCRRFHTHDEQPISKNNPLMRGTEDMCVNVDPGTYSITAGAWGGEQTQTHIVKLAPGQSANLDFVF